MLRLLDGIGLARYGFDLTPEMIDEAKIVLGKQGVDAGNLWAGSVTDRTSFRAPKENPAGYDAVICIGVLPHIPHEADRQVIENLKNSVRPGGRVLVEARNQMFALFTLNRFTSDLFIDTLIDESNFRKQAGSDEEQSGIDRAIAQLKTHFRLDLPPLRPSPNKDDPSYDEILSRTHNPFALKQLAEEIGLKDVEMLFYHFHAVPPMLEREIPELARRAALTLENPRDWRGYIQASAFILCAVRP